MSGEIKQDSAFDLAVARTGQLIINAFRWKMQQGGLDLSYENMADLRRGIEGEIIDFGTRLQQWQPIEFAPRDGTHILACRMPIGIRVTTMTNPPTVVHWFDDPEEPGFYTSVNERAPESPYNPTHWQPLGPLPTP